MLTYSNSRLKWITLVGKGKAILFIDHEGPLNVDARVNFFNSIAQEEDKVTSPKLQPVLFPVHVLNEASRFEGVARNLDSATVWD